MSARRIRQLVLAGLVVALLGLGPSASGEHEWGWELLARDVLWEGVEFTIVQEPTPVRTHVVHVHPGAPVRVKPVVSAGRVGSTRETVSSMCARTGSVACINANFATCPTCHMPHGAVVRKFQFVQSPTDHQYQLKIQDGRMQTGPIEWSARLEALRPEGLQQLPITGVNIGTRRDQITLHDKNFGASTGSPPGTVELVVRAPTPQWTGGVRQRATVLRLETGGNATIPRRGAVLSGSGMGAHVLWAFARDNADVPLDLVVESPAGLEMAVSGHPPLLAGGVATELDQIDGKVTGLHPRTLVGWDDAGSMWFVVVDGRQAHSRGLTLDESRELLERLGATHGINLDGGGSSTMVTSCAQGWCVRNRPSDGRERLVPVGLAIVPPEKW
ncbi:phosphodiester glycosidase family protein [Acidimicrobiia bacterium EGI L10123]|uniref:phosphodiester glycosidase family protein n=1 Tax=Salinilacustrithrix flava TaxID=2957203 RepID=UPI003D7C2CB1|nr:phosphodiester glycosidase family protein [Acidimicrobiia bacterium EGI L10123]